MTTPKVSKDIFKEVKAAFTPIVGAPNDDNVMRLTEAFINVIQSIDILGGAIDLSNLLLSDVEHETKHGDGKTFERMTVPLPDTTTALPPMQQTPSAPRPSAYGQQRSAYKH